MMDNKVRELLNKQINHEFYSAYLYYAMSAYFAEIAMDGFAKYMKNQAKEELTHAQRIFDHLILRNEKISFSRIEAPDNDWVNAGDIFSQALEHEKYVSEQIRQIYYAAQESNDIASMTFLNWFIDEQLEEEEKFRRLKDKIKAFEECSCTLEELDRAMDKNEEG